MSAAGGERMRWSWAGALTALPFAAACAFGVRSVAIVAASHGSGTTQASSSSAAAILDLASGLGLIIAGTLHRACLRRGSLGVAVAFAGVAWLAVDWIGSEATSALGRSVAMVLAPFVLAAVIHAAAAAQTGSVEERWARVVVGASYATTAFVSAGWAMFRDPFRDQYCWRNCIDNSLLVKWEPDIARYLGTTAMYGTVVAAVGLSAVCGWRWLIGTPTLRRRTAPVLGPAVGVALTYGAYAAALLIEPAENAERSAFMVLFVARAAALIALAAGVIWIVVRERETRRAITRLSGELGAAPPPGALQAALARSLGDARLEVLYWLPSRDQYVDGTGRARQPDPDATQTVTAIERNGQLIAVVLHDRSLTGTHDLAREIGSASRLAVDNERLRTEALAQLADLKASRMRIVETADSARRQLERNLHDGAQQRLLALSYELQLAEIDAVAEGDARLSDTLASARAIAGEALEELRDLAHGIYPVILAEAGLAPALATFVDTAPMVVELVDVPASRLPGETETAAYLTVTTAVEHAARRHSRRVVATFEPRSEQLGLEIVDDGAAVDAADWIHIGDRVGALGGRLEVDGSHVRAVIPCV